MTAGRPAPTEVVEPAATGGSSASGDLSGDPSGTDAPSAVEIAVAREDGPRPVVRRLLAPRRLYQPWLFALLGYAALGIWTFHPIWSDPVNNTLGGGGGDAAIFIWFLRWTAEALAHGSSPLFSDYVNVPDGVNVMWNTSLVLPGIVLAPVTLKFGPVLTFNLIASAALPLSAWTGYLAATRFVRSHLAAATAGLVYGFSPAMFAQAAGHIHMILMVLPPLLLLLVHELLVRQRWRAPLAGALLGLGAACQLLIGEEVLAFTVLVGIALTVLLVVLFPRQAWRRAPHALVGLATAAVIGGALAAWPLYTQLAGPQRITGDIQTVDRYFSDLLAFAVPTKYQLIAPAAAVETSSRFFGNRAEQNAYVGVPMLLIGLATTVALWRRPAARVAGLMALLVGAASLGTTLHVGGRSTGVRMPWGWVASLPLLESGLPNRLMLFAWIFLALLLALFVDTLARKGLLGRAVALVGAAAVVVALLPKGEIGGGPTRVPAFFRSAEVQRIPAGSTALIVPFPGPVRSQAMLWQAEAGMRFRIPGGYFVVPGPDGTPRFGPGPTSVNGLTVQVMRGARTPSVRGKIRRELVEELEAWNVRTVILGPVERNQDLLVEFLTSLLKKAPERVGGVWLWTGVDPVSLRTDSKPVKPRPRQHARVPLSPQLRPSG